MHKDKEPVKEGADDDKTEVSLLMGLRCEHYAFVQVRLAGLRVELFFFYSFFFKGFFDRVIDFIKPFRSFLRIREMSKKKFSYLIFF